jgi:hypothetical protein
MLYLFAAVGVIAVAVVLWRALMPVRDRERVGVTGRAVGPDDDPDFLRSLGEGNRAGDDEAGPDPD